MARLRKPTHLRLVEGDKSRRGFKAQAKEPRPKGDLVDPPASFEGHEGLLAIWAAAVASAPRGLLKRLDEGMLEGWCMAAYIRQRAWSKWKAGDEQFLIKTPNGAVQASPFLTIIRQQTVVMKAVAAEMGFSPAARSRVSVEEDPEDDATDHYFGTA